MTPSQFANIRHAANLSLEGLSRVILVSTRTIRRYEDEMRPKPIPAPIIKLMEMLRDGKLKPQPQKAAE